MRSSITAICLCLATLWSSVALAGDPQPRTLQPGLSIQRTITGIPLQSPFGMDIDQKTGNLYFIADNGAAIYVLEPNGDVGPLVTGVGPFGDRDADLRLGSDGLLYAIGPPVDGLSFIDRINLDGEVQARSNNFLGQPLSAFGLDFDCVGQLYMGDNSPELLRLEQDGFINIVSEGWSDIDEIEQGPDNTMFVHHAQRDRVFLQKPDGTRQVYVQGLNNIRAGAFDWGSNNYLVADVTNGTIFRLEDRDADGTIVEPTDRITPIASGFGQISDINWGVSSHSNLVFSLYVGSPNLGRIIEITGFAAPPGGSINCGNLVDDDGDGWCEFGFDNNGDRDCEDEFEEQPIGDCDDGRPEVNPDATEICDDLDNDCDPNTLDGSSDPLFRRPCDGDDADLCLEGEFFCARGVGIQCDDTTGDSREFCDGEDNDCNPDTPDGADEAGFGVPCDGDDDDLCPEGQGVCDPDAQSIVCSDDTDTNPDLCDGEDNDCNPDTPDGSTDPRLDEPCDGDDSDLCPEGTFTCNDGVPVCDDLTDDNLEVCDGQDNDCNLATLDGAGDPEVGIDCDGLDEDLCLEGVSACIGGRLSCEDLTGDIVDICDGQDNDCNPDTPDGSGELLFGEPCDGNDQDACADGVVVCTGFNLVCDDDEASTLEICNDGIDNDCDGNADDLDFDCRGSLDRDGDGFCADGEDFNDDGDCADEGEDEGRFDCNDVSSSIHPDAVENCVDNIDNDCDDARDLEDTDCARILDGDGDGFCADGQDLNGDGDCLDPSENNGERDCDETAAAINSGAEEVCDDGLDNDCDDATDALDSDCPDFADRDGDGFCPTGQDLNADGDCLDEGEDTDDSDCDDTDEEIAPGALEICGDDKDNDCNGLADVDDPVCAPRVDGDGDGYCPTGRDLDGDADCFDNREQTDDIDCDDADPNIGPEADELCGDEKDNDCNDLTDGDDPACGDQVDSDGDGVCPRGVDLNGDGDCLDEGEDTDDIDCNDAEPSVFGGNDEVCGDDADNDCDGDTDAEDDDCALFADRDNDDFCPQGRDFNDDGDCLDEGEDNGDVDCDDDEIFIHPDARENCADEIDNDCDGDVDGDDEDCVEPEPEVIPPAPKTPDDCGCATVHRPTQPAPWPALLLAVIAAVWVVRRP